MHYLHAYWRLAYIETPKTDTDHQNLFANLPKMQDDRKARIIYRGTHSYIVLNIYPYNPGHLLAVPYRAVQTLEQLEQDERLDLLESVITAQHILTQAMHPNGFNIGVNIGKAAGAGLPEHMHIHIVPRWEADTNFMPIIANTKILPEALDHLWERLRDIAEQIKSNTHRTK